MESASLLSMDFDVVPEPCATQELSEEDLQQYCGNQDLSQVGSLHMVVDSARQDLTCIGANLINLRQLKLSGSSIHWVRDLGTSLKVLEVLWLCRCHLQDLQGVSAMINLKELYVAFNDITETSPLHWHESLEIVDLEGNNLQDLDDLLEMGTCESLRELNTCSNPVCKVGGFSRKVLLEALPQLDVLDDVAVQDDLHSLTMEDVKSATNDDMTLSDGINIGTDTELNDLFVSLRLLDEAMELEVREPDCTEKLTGEEDEDDQEDEDNDQESGRHCDCEDSCAYRPDTQSAMIAAMALPEDWARASALIDADPDDCDLILEGVKQRRNGMHPSRTPVNEFPARRRPHFQFQLSSRVVPNTQKAELACQIDEEGASKLTRGECLAGNPLAAARQNRMQKSQQGSDMDIRSLLRIHQTYAQPSCLSEEELEERRLLAQVHLQRPCTPDVRVRTSGEFRPSTTIASLKRTQERQRPHVSVEPMDSSSVDERRREVAFVGCSKQMDCPLSNLQPKPPPVSKKCINVLAPKISPVPPPTPNSSSNSFRRVRGIHVNALSQDDPEQYAQDAEAVPVHPRHHRQLASICMNEVSEVIEAKKFISQSIVKNCASEDTQIKSSSEPASLEAEMMASMQKLVGGAPRFY